MSKKPKKLKKASARRKALREKRRRGIERKHVGIQFAPNVTTNTIGPYGEEVFEP